MVEYIVNEYLVYKGTVFNFNVIWDAATVV